MSTLESASGLLPYGALNARRFFSELFLVSGSVQASKPMDFHAWFEVYLDGAWYTFDARHNKPRIGRIVIGRGRDAVDVALTTIYGATELVNLSVWADAVDGSARPGLAWTLQNDHGIKSTGTPRRY